MPEITFETLQRRLQEHYAQDEYNEAFTLAHKFRDAYPMHRHLLYYWCSTMAARLGDQDGAVSFLRQMQDTSFWYGEVLLRKSPSYSSLQGLPEFEALVERNRQLQQIDQEQALQLLTIRGEGRCMDELDPCPLLVGLHANSGNAQTSIDFWRPAASEGWLVAVPQSSQAMWKGAYVWDDMQVSTWQIQHDLKSLQEQYAIDPDQIILAGHSMGGELAAYLSLSGIIPSLGFIAFGPGGPYMENLEKWASIIEEAAGTGVQGYIIIGERDHTIPQDSIFEFVELLNQNSIRCQLEIVSGVAHDFVPEYEDSMLRALSAFNE